MRKLNVDFPISDSFLDTDLRKGVCVVCMPTYMVGGREREISSTSITVAVTFKQA